MQNLTDKQVYLLQAIAEETQVESDGQFCYVLEALNRYNYRQCRIDFQTFQTLAIELEKLHLIDISPDDDAEDGDYSYDQFRMFKAGCIAAGVNPADFETVD